jgi:hypothetical protein
MYTHTHRERGGGGEGGGKRERARASERAREREREKRVEGLGFKKERARESERVRKRATVCGYEGECVRPYHHPIIHPYSPIIHTPKRQRHRSTAQAIQRYRDAKAETHRHIDI